MTKQTKTVTVWLVMDSVDLARRASFSCAVFPSRDSARIYVRHLERNRPYCCPKRAVAKAVVTVPPEVKP